MTALLLDFLPLPGAAALGGYAAVLAVLVSGYRRTFGSAVPVLLLVGTDRRIGVGNRRGHLRHGSILDDSYVGARLTTIVWCADGDSWWRPARTILVLPDTLPRDDHRRLRVALRYGRPAAGRETSAAEAG